MHFGNVVGGGHHVMVKRVTSAGYEVVGRALTVGSIDAQTPGRRAAVHGAHGFRIPMTSSWR